MRICKTKPFKDILIQTIKDPFTMFKIKNESADGSELSFTINNIDLSVVNGLRRTLIADIPVVAIRFHPNNANNPDVNFIANSCDLHNEMLGQRLSLIPIRMSDREVESYNRDKYKFVINVKNKGDEMMDITTAHIGIYNANGVKEPDALHESMFPPDPFTKDHCLITKLKPNHYDKVNGGQLHVEAWASVGTAKEWAGFSAVSLATFENVVDEQAANAALAKKLEGVAPSKADEVKHDFNHLDKYRHFKKNEAGDPTEFLFSIESTCGMPCRTLVHKAFDLLIRQLEQLIGGNGNIRMEAKKASNNIFAIMVHGINHTLGSILQAHIHKSDTVSYVGYNMPHPLEESVMLKIAFVDGAKMDTDAAINALRGLAKDTRDIIVGYQDTWVKQDKK